MRHTIVDRRFRFSGERFRAFLTERMRLVPDRGDRREAGRLGSTLYKPYIYIHIYIGLTRACVCIQIYRYIDAADSQTEEVHESQAERHERIFSGHNMEDMLGLT